MLEGKTVGLDLCRPPAILALLGTGASGRTGTACRRGRGRRLAGSTTTAAAAASTVFASHFAGEMRRKGNWTRLGI